MDESKIIHEAFSRHHCEALEEVVDKVDPRQIGAAMCTFGILMICKTLEHIDEEVKAKIIDRVYEDIKKYSKQNIKLTP